MCSNKSVTWSRECPTQSSLLEGWSRLCCSRDWNCSERFSGCIWNKDKFVSLLLYLFGLWNILWKPFTSSPFNWSHWKDEAKAFLSGYARRPEVELLLPWAVVLPKFSGKWSPLTCVASVSVRFRSKERGTRVKDRAKNGVSERAGRGWGSFLPCPTPSPTFIFWLLFHFSRGQNPRIPFLGLSLLRNQTETVATQARSPSESTHLAIQIW